MSQNWFKFRHRKNRARPFQESHHTRPCRVWQTCRNFSRIRSSVFHRLCFRLFQNPSELFLWSKFNPCLSRRFCQRVHRVEPQSRVGSLWRLSRRQIEYNLDVSLLPLQSLRILSPLWYWKEVEWFGIIWKPYRSRAAASISCCASQSACAFFWNSGLNLPSLWIR